MPDIASEGDEVWLMQVDEAFDIFTRALIGFVAVTLSVAMEVDVRALKDLRGTWIGDATTSDVVLSDGAVWFGQANGFGWPKVRGREFCPGRANKTSRTDAKCAPG